MKDKWPGIILEEPVISRLKNTGYDHKRVRVSMLRLDKIHPVISGNKLFKLYYFLDEAINSPHKKIITFGGAYSNHLVATAFACKEMNLKSIGIVRGEKPAKLSPTLLHCQSYGMQLEFLSREDYKKINEDEYLENLKNEYGEHTLVPEGGFSIKGKNGAALIASAYKGKRFSHVSMAVGTATTFAGMIDGSSDQCEVMGFSVLKDLRDVDQRLIALKVDLSKKYSLVQDYHFGGYAKKTDELISFINSFYLQNQIPLDFVYTGKMMFGVDDLIRKSYFPSGSDILCIHTGGLQGNQSLRKGTLIF